MSSAAPRVVRGWIAASVCSWTAFAAHAQAAPTTTSLVVMALITCISAVIAMALLGRKFSLLATSLVVLASQGLYHLSLSVMSTGALHLVPTRGSGVHAHQVTGLSVTGSPLAEAADSMVLAHLMAAVVSVFLLRQGEQIVRSLCQALSLSTVRRLLAVLHLEMPAWPRAGLIAFRSKPLLSRDPNRRPLLRGPPCPVLTCA